MTKSLPILILKIHDFSENYASLLPEEIQSLHWTQATATVYPIVVIRKVEDDICEDHIVFTSNDKKHDIPFVEYCNDILHRYYKDAGLSITHDIEYNDGYASQFKCVRAFSSLTRRKIKTTRVFCETSHGKSKSDVLRGVIKSYVSCAVCAEQEVIRDAKELFDFFNENLVVKAAHESSKPMLNRVFFYVSLEEINEHPSTFPSLGIHQVVTTPGKSKSVQYRNISCACTPCLRGNYRKFECLDHFKNYLKPITMTSHTFSISKEKQKDAVDDEDELIDLDED